MEPFQIFIRIVSYKSADIVLKKALDPAGLRRIGSVVERAAALGGIAAGIVVVVVVIAIVAHNFLLWERKYFVPKNNYRT